MNLKETLLVTALAYFAQSKHHRHEFKANVEACSDQLLSFQILPTDFKNSKLTEYQHMMLQYGNLLEGNTSAATEYKNKFKDFERAKCILELSDKQNWKKKWQTNTPQEKQAILAEYQQMLLKYQKMVHEFEVRADIMEYDFKQTYIQKYPIWEKQKFWIEKGLNVDRPQCAPFISMFSKLNFLEQVNQLEVANANIALYQALFAGTNIDQKVNRIIEFEKSHPNLANERCLVEHEQHLRWIEIWKALPQDDKSIFKGQFDQWSGDYDQQKKTLQQNIDKTQILMKDKFYKQNQRFKMVEYLSSSSFQNEGKRDEKAEQKMTSAVARYKTFEEKYNKKRIDNQTSILSAANTNTQKAQIWTPPLPAAATPSAKK